MSKKILALLLGTLILASAQLTQAGQAKVYRVGVIYHGGAWNAVVDGLRDGLKNFGLEEGKHFVLEIRDSKGDVKAVEEAAKNLERDKVDLLYAVGTSVTIPVRRVTADIPIVFYAGGDLVGLGLVDSFAKPGGRLTGVYSQVTDLTAKRLEILKQISPKLRRVLTFYNPSNRVSAAAATIGREEARRLRIELVERHVASVEELLAKLQSLKPGDVDGFIMVSDSLVLTQAQPIIDMAKAKKFATMLHEASLVANGALASYGPSYYGAGYTSAKHVQRILFGTEPKGLPVETINKIELVVNLSTAKQIGLTIPQRVLGRADKVIK
jgi:putative ABC transport system substrate-binding protein